MHDSDYYDLDDGDGIGRCVECGDPAYLCECRGYDDAADLEDDARECRLCGRAVVPVGVDYCTGACAYLASGVV